LLTAAGEVHKIMLCQCAVPILDTEELNKSVMVVIVFGLPGSGKSFFASRLALMIKGEYINSDQIRLKLFKKRKYTEDEKEKVYDTLFDLAQEAVKKGSNVVVDATFYKQYLRQRYLDEMSNDLFFIEVVTRKGIVKKRLSQPRAFSEADYSVYKKIKKEWEPFVDKHLVLESTNDNIGEMMDTAVLYLHLRHDK